MVDNIDGSYVTAFGAGLVGGMSGQMVSFTVTAKQGSLSKSTKPLPVQIMPILLLPNWYSNNTIPIYDADQKSYSLNSFYWNLMNIYILSGFHVQNVLFIQKLERMKIMKYTFLKIWLSDLPETRKIRIYFRNEKQITLTAHQHLSWSELIAPAPLHINDR